MGNVNGTEEGCPEGLMQMLQMLGQNRSNPWEEKARTVSTFIREGDTDTAKTAIQEFESPQALAYLVRELINNDGEQFSNTLDEIFPVFLSKVELTSEESDGSPITRAFRLCFERSRFTPMIYNRVVALYAGEVQPEMLPILASVCMSSARQSTSSDHTVSLIRLFLSKVDWKTTKNSGTTTILGDIMVLLSSSPSDIFTECWNVIKTISERQDEDGTHFLALMSIVKTMLESNVSDDVQSYVNKAAADITSIIRKMPEDKRKGLCLATLVTLGIKSRNHAFLQQVISTISDFPLDESESLNVHGSALLGGVVLHCRGENVSEDEALVRRLTQTALLSATVAKSGRSTDFVVQALAHLVDSHGAEFTPFILEQLNLMYRMNSASLTTNTIFARIASLALCGTVLEGNATTDEQITSVIETLLNTPNPFKLKGTINTIGLMIIPVLLLQERLPELHTRYMNWVRENSEHFKPMREALNEYMNMTDSQDEKYAIMLRNGLTEFFKLLE